MHLSCPASQRARGAPTEAKVHGRELKWPDSLSYSKLLPALQATCAYLFAPPFLILFIIDPSRIPTKAMLLHPHLAIPSS